MKREAILLIILIITGAAWAQKNTLQIAIKPTECQNCLNKIPLLNKVNLQKVAIVLVFEEGYKSERADLLSKLRINDTQYSIIFSDELFNNIIAGGITSTAVYYSGFGNDTLRFDLKTELDHIQIDKINRLSEDEFLVKSKDPIISQSTREMRNGEGFLFTLNRLNNTIYKTGITDSHRTLHFQLSADIVTTILNATMNDSNYVRKRDALFDAKGVFQRDEIVDYQVFDNRLLVTVGLKVLRFQGEDTILMTSNFLISTTNQEEAPLEVYTLENVGEGNYFLNANNFYYEGSELFFSMYSKERDNKDFKVARLRKEGAKGLQLAESYSADRNDSFYQLLNFNNYNALLYKDYLIYEYFNEITNYKDQYKVKLDFIPVTKTNGEASSRMCIFDFKILNDEVFIFYSDFETMKIHYVQYSIKDKSIVNEFIYPLENYKLNTAFCIDHFDYRYLWIPVDNYSVVRKKVF